MLRLLFTLVCLVAFVFDSMAQDESTSNADDFLKKLHGRWIGEGVVMRMPSRIEMVWEPVLAARFVRLTWRNHMTTSSSDAGFDFQGDAYYQAAGAGKYTGQWFDSGGESHRLESSVQGNSLTTIWGDPAGKLGRTVYQVTADNGIEVVDSIRGEDGEWHEFGRSLFRRAE